MGKKTLAIIIAAVLLIVAAVLAVVLFRMGIFSPKAKVEAPPKEMTFTIGDYSVNLDEPGYKRYIKTKMYVGYTIEKLDLELAEKTPQIRNAVNNILRSKKVEDVSSTENMNEVVSEIKDEINSILTTGKIEAIYITEILIQ